MTIQGSVYVQNLMENETIKSDFEFAHIRHTYGTFFEIWAKFPRFWPDFQRFRFLLLRGARARQYTQNDRQPHLCPNILSKSIMGHLSWIYDSKTIFYLILGHLVAILLKFPTQPSQGHIWGAEISTISQKFLDIHIRIKIPNMIHIHHFPVYDLDIAPWGGDPLSWAMHWHLSHLLHI